MTKEAELVLCVLVSDDIRRMKKRCCVQHKPLIALRVSRRTTSQSRRTPCPESRKIRLNSSFDVGVMKIEQVDGSTAVGVDAFISLSEVWIGTDDGSRGRGHFDETRDRPLKWEDWSQHLMNFYDGRFATHRRFPHFLLNTHERSVAIQQAGVFVARDPQAGRLTLGQLRNLGTN